MLELHWSAPGTGPQFLPHGQSPMPNRHHTPALWTSVANTFKSYSNVAFDLFNEPYPHWNTDSPNAWQCWRDGSDPTDPTNSRRCIGTEWWDTNGNTFNGGKPYTYAVAGMQELLTAVRAHRRSQPRPALRHPVRQHPDRLAHPQAHRPHRQPRRRLARLPLQHLQHRHAAGTPPSPPSPDRAAHHRRDRGPRLPDELRRNRS